MAYELKRSQRIQEEIKIGDDTITINLDIDSITKEFNKRYNAIIAAELEIKNVQLIENNAEKLNVAMESYGNTVIELFCLVFGEDGAMKILNFYENNYMEMSVEVFPFIINVIMPKIQQGIEEQRKKLAEQYKYKQNSVLDLNRKQRRKLGL